VTQEVTLNKHELLMAIRKECVMFLAFYLGEELTLTVPEFHIEIWDELLEILDQVNQPDQVIGHLQKLFAVPREHSKSTLAKLAVILFMRYSPFRFTMYVSKTNTVAMQAIKDIIMWLKSPQEQELYGPVTMVKSNETESLWILIIFLADGRTQKRIIFKAMGSNQQVRGTLIENMRPELIILDDIEDLDTADDGIQQKKLNEWVMGSLLKASARRSVRVFVGNMIRSTTLLAKLSKDPEWNPTVFGALVKDKVTGKLQALWEGRWTVAALLKDYMSYRRLGLGHVWEAEMMNLAADTLLAMNLDGSVIVPDINPEELTAGFICLDPAFGQNSWNDESAITVHVRKHGVGIPIVCDSRKGRWTESQVFDEMMALSYYWNLATWTIEAAAAQKLLIPLFRLFCIERGMPPDTFTILPMTGGQEAKSSRINAFRQSIASKSYGLTESQIELKLRLEEYSPDTKVHDDLCDSGAFGPIVWNMYGQMIESQGVQSMAGRLMQVRNQNTMNLGERDVCLF
jgi:hypothetical protein